MTSRQHAARDADPPREDTLSSLHWGMFALLGLALIVIGFAAIAFPFLATFAVEVLIGSVLVAGGIAQMAQAWSCTRWRGCVLTAVTGLLSVLVGGLLLAFPSEGMVLITLVVAAYLLVSGALRITLALTVRPHDSWGWVLLSGALALALALVLMLQFPAVGIWLLGLMVGVDLVFAGWWALLVARVRRRPPHPSR